MKLKMSNRLQIFENGNNFYIYNSVFGNFLETDEATLDLLRSFENGKDVKEDSKITDLMKRGFLLESIKDEYAILKEGHKEFLQNVKSGKLLRKLQLMVTTGCNMACKYCYEDRTGGKMDSIKKGNMSFQVAKKAIDGFLDIVEENKQEKAFVRYFGGEPLLNWDVIERSSEYISYINSKTKVVQLINTNGTLMTEEIAKHLGEHKFEVDLSLDAPNENNDKTRVYKNCKGTFEEICKAGDLLLKHDVETEISATLTDYNIDQLKQFIDFIDNKGFEVLEINTIIYDDTKLCTASIGERVNNLIAAKEYARERGVELKGKWIKLYQRVKNGALNYCGRLGEQFSVTKEGEIYPCSGLSIKLGTINDLKSIFLTDEYEKLSMRIVGNIPACLNCEIEGMCVGGCPGSADYLGSAEEYNPEYTECEFRKAIVKAQIGDEFKEEDPCYQSITKNYFA
jgi:uncharacterized protein